MLCSVCKALPALTEFNMPESHHTLQSLKLSAEDGCECCHVIWHSLSPMHSVQNILDGKAEETAQQAEVTLHYSPLMVLQQPVNRPRAQYIHVSPSVHGEGGSLLELFSDGGDDSPDLIDGRRVAPRHDSESTFKFIHQSLLACLNGHQDCLANVNVVLPSYVLDVGSTNDGSTIRVVQNDGTMTGTYLTLSYCWGGPQAVQLTTKTITTYKNDIPFSSLPQTLQDAVTVTRTLGYRYLWIDALCIVQDDETSKQKELAQMRRIYTSSFLTIQPTISGSVNQGFLASRQPPSVQPVRLLFQEDVEGRRPTYVYARVRYEEGKETMTSSRAWIFQETVLPARLLVYGRLQTIMVCRKQVFREDGMSHGAGNISPLNYHNIRPIPNDAGSTDDDGLRKSVLTSWYHCVGAFYSKRAHAVSDDRLNALSAYAEEAHGTIGGQYLAGIWGADLTRGLGWKRHHGALTRALSYRAPSWSWAAYDGQVGYGDTNLSASRVRWNLEHGPKDPDPKFQPRLIEAGVTNVGISRFGACSNGRIVLETLVGPAIAIGLSENRRESRYDTPRGGVQLTTTDSAHGICTGWLDITHDLPLHVICASLTGLSGLLLVGSDTSNDGKRDFRRVGVFRRSLKCSAAGFEAWRQSCRLEAVALL